MKRPSVDDHEPDSHKFPKMMIDDQQTDSTQPTTLPALPPSNHDRPDEKSQRYDRQLRLWAASGQKELEKASIIIAPSTATSSQITKNLALPGIARVNLLDEEPVRQCDIGNDFFLEQSSLGKNRAKECARLLQELNPAAWIQGDSCGFNESGVFDIDLTMGMAEVQLVIGVRLSEEIEAETAYMCWSNNVPLILVQTCGFIGSIRVQFRELGLIETHPDSLVDLRLDCPFPSLVNFVKSFDFQSMENHDHAHIPAVAILVHFLETFKSNHDGQLPQNLSQRDELKQMILAEKRNVDEENFDEAVGMIWKACKPTLIPEHVQELFLDPCCDRIPYHQQQFWILVRTLREFSERRRSDGDSKGRLPLSGVLPDMESDTKNYVQLQTIYRQQAEADLKEFQAILREFMEKLPAPKHPSYEQDEDGQGYDWEEIPNEVVQSFVKHSAHIRLIRGRSLEEERKSPRELVSQLQSACDSGGEQSSLMWYLALRACALFRSKNEGRYPGSLEDEADADLASLKNLITGYLNRHGWKEASNQNPELPPMLEEALKEIVRSAGSELPQISALIGGLAAQESIKLITRQYIPLNGTCIFDGIKSCTGVLDL